MAKRKRKAAYVVFRGRKCGVFETWDETLELVNGFSGAKYQGYATRSEAECAWREDPAAAPRALSVSAAATAASTLVCPAHGASAVPPTSAAVAATALASTFVRAIGAPAAPATSVAIAAPADGPPPWARHTRGFGADQLARMGYTGRALVEVTQRPTGAGLGFDGADARAVELTEEQERVCSAAMAGESMFFTGSAGTGKTTTMRALITRLKQRSHSLDTGKVFVTASTGAAAVLCRGTTLHSFAGVGLGTESAASLISKLSKSAHKRWGQCSTLVIDEISMIDGVLLDKIDSVARAARGVATKPFGGVQVVVSGDFMQLPPVRVERFAFEADVWQAAFGAGATSRQFCLKRVFRQRDATFVHLLNELRVGRASPATCATLQATATRGLSAVRGIEPTKLFARNAQVDVVNNHKLAGLTGAATTLLARDEGDGVRIKQCSYPAKLVIKEGAQIMLLHNVDVRRGLVNGSRGVITSIKRERDRVEVISCNFRRGGDHDVGRETATIEEAGKVLASRTQFPLRLAWALSIHKSQGQTIDLLDCDLGGCFEDGQAYTAVSRAVDLEHVVVRNFSQGVVRASRRCLDFDAGLQDGAAALSGRTIDEDTDMVDLTVDKPSMVDLTGDNPVPGFGD